MSTTAQPQATQAQVTPVAANMFTVAGGSSMSATTRVASTGKPHLSYQDPMRSLSFTGDEIRQVECDLGAVVSVTLQGTASNVMF